MSALAGVPAAVSTLTAALHLEDRPWAAVAGALVDLLRRHAAGLTGAIARDELDAVFRTSACTSPRERGGDVSDREVWEGEVIVVQKTPRPHAWVVKRSGERLRVFGMFVAEEAAVFGRPGVRVRVWPEGGAVQDISGRAAVEALEETREEKGGGEERSLLPGRPFVFEMEVSGWGGKGGSAMDFPDYASVLLRQRTLQAVWVERSSSPAWVSARIVEVSPDALRLQDIDAHGSDQPTVMLQLVGHQTGYAHLLCVGDVVLLNAPAVMPTGQSFDLGFGEGTVVFVARNAVVSDAHKEAKKELKVLKAPLLKRQRVTGDESATAAGIGVDDVEETLARLKVPVTPEHLLALRNPKRQALFNMLAVTCATPRIPSMTQSEAGAVCTLRLSGGITIELTTKWSDDVSQIAAGHVLWLSGLKTLGGSSTWECAAFVNVSMLPGAICSPFMRKTTSVENMNRVAILQPDTVYVDVIIDSVSADNDDLCVEMGVSDFLLSPGAGRGQASAAHRSSSSLAVVDNNAVLSQLLGTSISEFWFGAANAKVRSNRLSALVGSRYRMSVAMSTESGEVVNYCAAISRVNGASKLR